MLLRQHYAAGDEVGVDGEAHVVGWDGLAEDVRGLRVQVFGLGQVFVGLLLAAEAD